jgi:hypothetical protein
MLADVLVDVLIVLVILGVQTVTGTRITCHSSCAFGIITQVVTPAQSVLAGHSHTTAPPRAYRHSKPAAHQTEAARRPRLVPARGKLPRATLCCVLVVKTVTADTASAAAGGSCVLRPSAKPNGYTTPATKSRSTSLSDAGEREGERN